jgi:hypothetical protein
MDAVLEAQLPVGEGGVIHSQDLVWVGKPLPDVKEWTTDEVVCKDDLHGHDANR